MPYRSLSLKILEDEINEMGGLIDGGSLSEKKIKRDLEKEEREILKDKRNVVRNIMNLRKKN